MFFSYFHQFQENITNLILFSYFQQFPENITNLIRLSYFHQFQENIKNSNAIFLLLHISLMLLNRKMGNLIKTVTFAGLINLPSAVWNALHQEYLKTLSLPVVRWVTNVLLADATSFRQLNPSRASNVGTATFHHTSLIFLPLAQRFGEVKTIKNKPENQDIDAPEQKRVNIKLKFMSDRFSDRVSDQMLNKTKGVKPSTITSFAPNSN